MSGNVTPIKEPPDMFRMELTAWPHRGTVSFQDIEFPVDGNGYLRVRGQIIHRGNAEALLPLLQAWLDRVSSAKAALYSEFQPPTDTNQ